MFSNKELFKFFVARSDFRISVYKIDIYMEYKYTYCYTIKYLESRYLSLGADKIFKCLYFCFRYLHLLKMNGNLHFFLELNDFCNFSQ